MKFLDLTPTKPEGRWQISWQTSIPKYKESYLSCFSSATSLFATWHDVQQENPLFFNRAPTFQRLYQPLLQDFFQSTINDNSKEWCKLPGRLGRGGKAPGWWIGMNWELLAWLGVWVTGVFLASDTGVFLISVWDFTWCKRKYEKTKSLFLNFHINHIMSQAKN